MKPTETMEEIIKDDKNGVKRTNGSTLTSTNPSYPSDSLAFLQQRQNGMEPKSHRSSINLKIIIVGAGLGGLATACALARRGHTVTIFEQTSQLGEVCAPTLQWIHLLTMRG